MKRICFFFALTMSTHVFAIKTIKLEDVIGREQMDAKFNYVPGPKHKSIQTTLTNNTPQVMRVAVDAGLLLQSEFTQCQNHLITQSDTFTIKPNEVRVVKLTGMCCERGDSGPYINSKFTLIKNKRGDLQELCRIIDSLGLIGHEAQTAIWSLADRSNPNAVYGGDSAAVMTLRHFIGKKLKKTVDPYDERCYVQRVRSLPSILFNGAGDLMLDSINASDKYVLELYDVDTDERLQNIQCDRIYIQKRNFNLYISNIRLNNLKPQTSYIVRLNKNGVVNMEWLYVVG